MYTGTVISFLYLLMEGHSKLTQIFGFLCWFGFFPARLSSYRQWKNFAFLNEIMVYWTILNLSVCLSLKNSIFHFQTLYHLSEDIFMSLRNVTSERPSLVSEQRVCMFILQNNCNESRASSVAAQGSSMSLRCSGTILFRTLSNDSNYYWSLGCFKSATTDKF